jgi:outer membrane protein assembly factor BamB
VFAYACQIGTCAQAWSMFRHDNMRTGCAEGFVPLINHTLWTYNHTGAWIVTSPVIADGIVVIGDEYLDQSNPTPHVYALSETTGELLWNCSVSGWPWTPTLSDGRVLFGATDGSAYSLDAANGTIVWDKDLGDAIDSSPAVLDGAIYLGTLDGELFALNQTNGETIWFRDLGYQCALSPAVAYGTIFVEAMQTPGVTLWALNKSTGLPEWTFNYTSNLWFPQWWQQVPLTSPAVFNGKVYTGGDGFYCLNATSGQVIWQNKTIHVSCSPSTYEDTVFIGGNSSLFAFKQDTGALIWQYQLNDTYDAFYSSPAAGFGIVAVTSHGGSSGSGDSFIYALNATDGHQIWHYDTADKETMISSAIADGKLFAPTPHRLFVFGDSTPPTIGVPSRRPKTVMPYQNVTVSVNASDPESGIENITLYYSTDNRTTWKELVPMHYDMSTAVFEALIPGQPANTWVDYKIIAYDQAGNRATLDGTEPYCTYQVATEFASSIAPIVLIITILSAFILIKKQRSPQTP